MNKPIAFVFRGKSHRGARISKLIGRIFVKGLVLLLPFVVTIYIIFWLVSGLEATIAPLWEWLIGEEHYRPGMGIALAIAIIFGAGALANAFFFRWIIQAGETLFERLPLTKTIYGAVRDFSTYFATSRKAGNQVVIVDIDGNRVVGLVTRDDFAGMPEGVAKVDHVAVYFPMSYMIGGYMVLVPRDRLQPVELSFEEAMKFVITAGVTWDANKKNSVLHDALTDHDGTLASQSPTVPQGHAYDSISPRSRQ